MRFTLLGPLGAEAENGPVELGPPKQRSVLAVLLLHANEIVSTDRIIDLVWGDDPPRTADHSVQIYVSELRKALSNGSPSNLIETRPPGYVLNSPPDAIDARRFERLVRDGLTAVRTGDLNRGKSMLEKGLALWTTSPLSDFPYDEFAQGYIRSLAEMRADALETLAGLYLDQGDADTARELARRVIDSDPLREEPHRLAMLALYRAGRQADALREYGEYRDLIGEELGIDPSPTLKDLEERILLQDPTLSVGEPTRATDSNPYRGLRAFSEEDADLYFGREDLISEVLDKIRAGHGMVSIVGPSGCGKSSAAQAGVIPALREAGETVVMFQPGARPLWELAGALDRAGFGSRATLLRRFETDADSLAELTDRPVVVVIDQFEELFTLAEPDVATRFGQLIAQAVRDPRCRLRVVATLRADYYDRPLTMAELAGVFSEATVSVSPMTAQGLERAVVMPARAAGRQIEPELLAEIVADMVDEPGALPLLQYTLFELFDRSEGTLTLEGYRAIGGIHGALARGAEETLEDLDAEGQEIAEQLFMRMVRKGRALPTSRPATLRELLDLEDDRLALQTVLDAFGSRRLLTFGRDASGAAVVEIAHEYLISEWPQLESWIGEHSEDLERLVVLGDDAASWEENDRSDDYLLRGDRLQRTAEWRDATAIRLTTGETRFLDASISLREREEATEAERLEREAALTKRARRRLWAFGIAVAALAAVGMFLVMALLPDPPPDVIVWYQGRNNFFGGMVGDGIDAAVAKTDLDVLELIQLGDELLIEELLDRGTGMIVLDFDKVLYVSSQNEPRERPDVEFFIVDCDETFLASPDRPPNVSCVTFNNREVGFVAGVAAGLTTDTQKVGFIGGVDAPIIREMGNGFRAGVAYVNPTVDIEEIYLTGFTPPGLFDTSGWWAPPLAKMAGEYLYQSGSDVVFHAAGGAGRGLFEAASVFSETTGTQVWAIGVDSDEYVAIEGGGLLSPLDELDPDGLIYERWRAHLLTSALKLTSVGVEVGLVDYANTGDPGDVFMGFENGGVGYATSGGYIDHLTPEMDAAIQAFIDGEVQFEVDYDTQVVLIEDLLEFAE